MQRLQLSQAVLIQVHGGLPAVLAKQSLDAGQSGPDHFAHGLIHGCRECLLELADHQAGAADDFAPIRLQRAHDELERRRLAGAVTADQAHALTRVDREFGVFQDCQFAESERYRLKPE